MTEEVKARAREIASRDGVPDFDALPLVLQMAYMKQAAGELNNEAALPDKPAGE